LDEEQHQQAAGGIEKLRKFGTVDSRPGSVMQTTQLLMKASTQLSRYAESGRQTSEPSNSQRNFTWGGEIHRSSVSRIIYKKRSASQVLQEKVRSTADWSA